MSQASATEYLIVGCLSVAMAIFSVAIIAISGEWPTDYGA